MTRGHGAARRLITRRVQCRDQERAPRPPRRRAAAELEALFSAARQTTQPCWKPTTRASTIASHPLVRPHTTQGGAPNGRPTTHSMTLDFPRFRTTRDRAATSNPIGARASRWGARRTPRSTRSRIAGATQPIKGWSNSINPQSIGPVSLSSSRSSQSGSFLGGSVWPGSWSRAQCRP